MGYLWKYAKLSFQTSNTLVHFRDTNKDIFDEIWEQQNWHVQGPER